MTEPLQKEQAAKLPRGFALLREPSLNKGTAFTGLDTEAGQEADKIWFYVILATYPSTPA